MNGPTVDEERFIQVRFFELYFPIRQRSLRLLSKDLTIVETISDIAAPWLEEYQNVHKDEVKLRT